MTLKTSGDPEVDCVCVTAMKQGSLSISLIHTPRASYAKPSVTTGGRRPLSLRSKPDDPEDTPY